MLLFGVPEVGIIRRAQNIVPAGAPEPLNAGKELDERITSPESAHFARYGSEPVQRTLF
jgi:hypothetical protein